MKHLLFLLCALTLSQRVAAAPAPATIVTFDSAKVTLGEALPGSNVVVTASFRIQPGYYLHVNRPTVQRATPTQILLGTSPAARSLPAAYSAPSQKTIPGNTMPVNVHEGVLSAQLPVVIAPNATFPIILQGAIAYAPVNEKTHAAARPEQVRFTVTIPRATNAPPANAKAPANAKTPADPKKK